MNLISAKLFTATLKTGVLCSIELYLNQSGTFGYRMWNTKGFEIIKNDFDDGTAAYSWYEHQIELFKNEMKKGKKSKILSWREVK